MRKFIFFLATTLNLFSVNPLIEDLSSYYSSKTLYTTCGGLLIAGAIANSSLDQTLFDLYQDHLHVANDDPLLAVPRMLGSDGAFYAFYGLGALSLATSGSSTGSFTRELFTKSFRAFIVGTVPLHLVRQLVGGCRPKATNRSSYWSPFTLPHGASGDTYTGAIPLITCAMMVKNPYIKYLLYGSSFLSGMGRINDSYHYPSQVLLGWTMAYVACDAVLIADSNINLSATADRVSFDFEF